MSTLAFLVLWLRLRVPGGGRVAEAVPFSAVLAAPAATPTPTTPSSNTGAVSISTFFGRLTGDLTIFALAMAGFFFALSALFYMASGATGNERMRQHAVSSLYAALAGLALALLATTITALVNTAVTG